MRPTWQDRLEALGARLAFGLFGALPLAAASALGGWLARSIGPRLGVTKRALINLERAMPELAPEARATVIREMWDNLGRVVAEYPHLGRIPIYAPGGPVEPIGTESVIDPLLAAGKRIIFVSAHYGNWEIATLAATQKGLDVAQIYRAANNPLIDQLITGWRTPVGSELIPKGRVAARRSIEALRKGRHLAVLVDQKMNDGIAVPFFGRPAMTAPAIAELALRFGCCIVPARVERIGRGARFRLTVEAPVEIAPTGEREPDILAVMTEVNARIERWVRERPGQWFWLHRRWPD